MPPKPKVICTCSICSKLTCENKHGIRVPGRKDRESRDKGNIPFTPEPPTAPSSEASGNQLSEENTPSQAQKVPDLSAVIEPVFQMCWLLAAWLSLCAGVSRKTVNTVLKCLGYGVSTAIPKIDIPKDICTVYARAQLEPELAFSKLQQPNPVHQDRMSDIQDSPAWQSLKGFLTSKYHLVFAVYIDWFNPYTNKIAEIRFLPENVFIVGMMPAPHSPTIWTISHILVSFQRAIAEFDLPGKIIATHSHPGGITIALRLIPLIADLQAIRKMRDGATVRAQAMEWQNLVTVTAKETLARQTGVRWTPMHNFPYWNLAKYVVLGFMHNFLEGILAFQLRALWGIGRTKEMLKSITQILDDESSSSIDTDELVQESQDLEIEAEYASQHESATGLTENFDHMDVDDKGEVDDEREPTPMPQLFIPLDDEGDEIDEDFVPLDVETAFDFTPEQLGSIRNCILHVLLPASSDRPPPNLGEASYGKLKAHGLLVLFTVILPLIIPELWWKGNEVETKRLQSFCDLVASTNIISAYSTSNVDADKYMYHYVKYRASIQDLHPGFKSMPNHHYAMHGGDQLKFWGPLSLLSEFPGERMNGDFGQIKTNKHLGDMEFIMVYKSACKGRLEASLHDNQYTNPATQKLAEILEPKDVFAFMHNPETMTGQQIAKLADGTVLSKDHYAILLKYLNNSGREYKSAYTNSRYPLGTLILPTIAQNHTQIPFNNSTYSCYKSHEGQSHIQFYIPGGYGGAWETGYIETIWELPLEGVKHTFLLV
ncbi:hypothetical protein EV368DRAFT_61194 [Lentinula lateritia]|nr:hypothetical protein EV368DRAFT_61194 [Lentinula lateritia]